MSVCSVSGCGGKRHGHGLCRTHYYAEFAWKSVAWKKANPEKVKAHKRAYHIRHAAEIKAAVVEWARENPEKRRANIASWMKAHADSVNANTANRRATKLNATPTWANQFFIKEAYHLARLRTQITGYKWHVDHIVPLQSKVVCGLHCEANLQVIPAVTNRMKHNREWPDMPT